MNVYDGVTLHFNMQKLQTLGFGFGLDKLSEEHNPIDSRVEKFV